MKHSAQVQMLRAIAAGVAVVAACTFPLKAQRATSFTTVTADGVTIHGEPYFGTLDATTPLVLLFHQGGSNGRGEYNDIALWLNEAGFRAIAWDQRSGGDLYGETNRTVEGLAADADPGFREAHPDLQAALDYVTSHGIAERVVAWGSSYSGALVFRLAAENQSRVSGVIAFSPASGGPMIDCRARSWIEALAVPVLVLRPQSEMERSSSIEQREILMDSGAQFHIVENGIHGSSMLLDARTGHDMRGARQTVAEWLGARVSAVRPG
jgi:alpha-beta hydrolase superfamily lysophospholipase